MYDFVPTMKSLDADKKANKSSAAASAEVEKPVEKIDFSKVKVEPLFEDCVDFETFSISNSSLLLKVNSSDKVLIPYSKILIVAFFPINIEKISISPKESP